MRMRGGGASAQRRTKSPLAFAVLSRSDFLSPPSTDAGHTKGCQITTCMRSCSSFHVERGKPQLFADSLFAAWSRMFHVVKKAALGVVD